VPAVLLLAIAAGRRRAIAALFACALAAVLAYAHVIWWVPVDHPLHSELHLGPLQLVFADAYVLLALVTIALAALLAARAAIARATAAASMRASLEAGLQ
jgi:hypothetical protein